MKKELLKAIEEVKGSNLSDTTKLVLMKLFKEKMFEIDYEEKAVEDRKHFYEEGWSTNRETKK